MFEILYPFFKRESSTEVPKITKNNEKKELYFSLYLVIFRYFSTAFPLAFSRYKHVGIRLKKNTNTEAKRLFPTFIKTQIQNLILIKKQLNLNWKYKSEPNPMLFKFSQVGRYRVKEEIEEHPTKNKNKIIARFRNTLL